MNAEIPTDGAGASAPEPRRAVNFGRPAGTRVRGAATRSDPDGLQTLKLACIAAVTLNHVNMICFSGWANDVLYAATQFGFPGLLAIMSLRLAEDPTRDVRYLKRLVPIALVSAIPYYMLLAAKFGTESLDPGVFSVAVVGMGNIMSTYVVGILMHVTFRRTRDFLDTGAGGEVVVVSALTVSAAAALVPALLAPHVSYGPAGPVMLPALVLASRTFGRPGFAVLAGGASFLVEVQTSMYFGLLSVPASLALAAYLLVRPKLRCPRIGVRVFYVYYPIHMFVLAVAGGGATVVY